MTLRGSKLVEEADSNVKWTKAKHRIAVVYYWAEHLGLKIVLK